MTNTKVTLKNYSIFIGSDAQPLRDFLAKSTVIVLCDANTKTHCLPVFLTKMGGFSPKIIEIEPGETHKTLETCQKIWQKLLEFQADRHTKMVCLGGGVVGDMGGFCAATWKRGVPFVQVPTTLLSMVDSSIGGKLGIDFAGVKNTIGVFSDPKMVAIFPEFLTTLSDRELRSGFAEMVKHTLISSKKDWLLLKKQTKSLDLDWNLWIPRSLKVKQKIVKIDPFEQNIRKALNFGHTIGHAVESYFLETEKPLLHGEAIAIGMICESWISMKLGNISEKELTEITNFLIKMYGKIALPEAAFLTIIETMRHDKKNASGEIRFALLGKIGQAVWDLTVSEADILASLRFYNLISESRFSEF
jgi:3-dehydroquinate synthase